jgi:hypothetical protein
VVNFSILAAAILLAFSLSGCASNSGVTRTEDAIQPVLTKPKLGGFNLQKRHGLGGWEQNSGPSEQQLLKQMTIPVQSEKENH